MSEERKMWDMETFNKNLEAVNEDCEKLIQKHLDAGISPLAVCGGLMANVSELFRLGAFGREEFDAMVANAWEHFGDPSNDSQVMH